jgi:hypothetical protein
MIYQDEQQEKADRIAFLSAVGSFMQTALPAAQASPELTPMLCEMLKFGVTAFKAGKQLEGIIDQTADDLRKQYEQSKGQPKPPAPEVQKMQMTMQLEQAKMQARQGELQAQSQLEQQKMQMQMELEKAKQEYQAQENQLKFQLEEQRNAKEAEMANNKDILLAYLDNSTKIETTRISQGLDDGSAAYSANVETAKLLQDTMGYNMTQHPLEPVLQDLQLHNQQLQQVLTAIYEKLHTPKEIIRDSQGKIVGVK